MKEYSQNQNKIFWSPSVMWSNSGEKLKIEIFSYSKLFGDIFPEFYFLTQKGILESELLSKFENFDKQKLTFFINDLKKKRILVDSILTPSEIFYPQKNLLEHNYGDSLMLDNEVLAVFRKKQLNRNLFNEPIESIQLNSDRKTPDFIFERRTLRKFDQTKVIPFDDFCYLASAYKQINEDEEIRYQYGSAGGLYPIDIYYYIKNSRVENIDGGLYYYDPVKNSLIIVDSNCKIDKETHYYNNQSIFSESAFSILFFYNGEVSMPKYGGMGYFYSLIDLGIMVQLYTVLAEHTKMGICSIGELNFKSIESYFKLRKNQVFIHDVEVGLK